MVEGEDPIRSTEAFMDTFLNLKLTVEELYNLDQENY